jgi:hypothetical protein
LREKEVRKYLRTLLAGEYPERLIEGFKSHLSEEDPRNALAELIKLGRRLQMILTPSGKSWKGRNMSCHRYSSRLAKRRSGDHG